MKRISVIGCGGSGKTTLAKILHDKTDLPLYHLDCIAYADNWQEVSPEIFKDSHKNWIDKDNWIIEGTMITSLEQRLSRSDQCIFLDMPRWLCIIRIFKRLIFEYGKNRQDMANGCVESFDWPFLQYVWQFNHQTRPKILKILDKNAQNCDIITIKTKADLNKWIKNQ
jgi:adenylate kinase family enzyme